MHILNHLFELEKTNPNNYDLGKEIRDYIIDIRGKIKEIENDINSLLVFNKKCEEEDLFSPLSLRNIEQCRNLLNALLTRGISKPKVIPSHTSSINLEWEFDDSIIEVEIEYSQWYNIFMKGKKGDVIDEKFLISSDVNEVCDNIEKIIKKIC